MYRENIRFAHNRLLLAGLLLGVTFLVFLLAHFQKSVLGHKYYAQLAEKNRVKETQVIAPRGVFFDRDNQPLVSNQVSARYGYTRTYLYPRSTAHILGYLSLPDEVNLKDYSCGAAPLTNQFMGRSGLEKYYECALRGRPGKSIVEVNAMGNKTRELAKVEPQQGQNIHLTLSLALQQRAKRAFQNQPGAAIATNPQTGEVLLYYSNPSYNANDLLTKMGLYSELAGRSDKPLFDRLSSGLYPPGSVIKPLIALGALEQGIISETTSYEDKGIFKLGGLEFGNWYYLQYGKTEGEVDVVKAIKRSNDIFFYHLGVEMGVKRINDWLRRFGFTKNHLGNYLPQALSVLPSDQWKRQTLGEPWYLGDTVNLSIGQGFLLVNPIEMHQGISILASGGRDCPLHFNVNDQPECTQLNLNSQHLSTISRGMIQACRTGGTAWPFFDFKVNKRKISVACKTGTAEAGQERSPHAWFTVFAPPQNPQIALTVLVENGGEGSSVAAPIAKEILTEYFSRY